MSNYHRPRILFLLPSEKTRNSILFFEDAIGAIDGTHFDCSPSKADLPAARDRKGGTTQNCLAVCDFNLRFKYIFSGWDGSASDSTMYHDARLTDLTIPAGKYFLADAGFLTSHDTSHVNLLVSRNSSHASCLPFFILPLSLSTH